MDNTAINSVTKHVQHGPTEPFLIDTTKKIYPCSPRDRDVFEDTARAARAQGAEEAGLGGDDDEERERQEHWQRQRRYREWQGFG